MGYISDLWWRISKNTAGVPPAVIIQASGLPLSEKKKLIGMLSQPDPVKQAAQQATIQKTQAEAEKLHAEAGKAQTAGMLNLVKAQTEGQPDAPAQPKGPLDVMQQMADINENNTTAEH